MLPIPFNPNHKVDLGKRWRGRFASLEELDNVGITPYYKSGRRMWKATRHLPYGIGEVTCRANNPLVARDLASLKGSRLISRLPRAAMTWGCKTSESRTTGLVGDIETSWAN